MQRILVRTCNGLELRDPPYMPADQYVPYGNAVSNRYSSYRGGKQADFEVGGGGGDSAESPLLEDDDDGVPPFTDLPARAKSSLSHHSLHSHHSFRSVREYSDQK